MKGTDAPRSSYCTTAVYKGLTVAVYTVDKTEISLTRQDLVELVNVCTVLRVLRLRDGETVSVSECVMHACCMLWQVCRNIRNKWCCMKFNSCL